MTYTVVPHYDEHAKCCRYHLVTSRGERHWQTYFNAAEAEARAAELNAQLISRSPRSPGQPAASVPSTRQQQECVA